MKHVNVTLAQRDMSMLAPLIGGRWVFMAGEAMTPHMFSPVDVIVNTTNGAVRIVSETFESDFEGGEDDTYARLWISDDVSGLRVARREGNVYVHHRDELIDDVLVVRDTVSAIESGETLWTLTTVVAIVFKLSGSVISIAKGSHHTEMLSVTIARGLKLLEIPDCVDEWRDDLTIRHESSRELIPLAALMADGPR